MLFNLRYETQEVQQLLDRINELISGELDNKASDVAKLKDILELYKYIFKEKHNYNSNILNNISYLILRDKIKLTKEDLLRY